MGPVPEVRYLNGVAAIQKGDFADARASLSALLKDSPEHIDGLLLMAWLYVSREEYEQAKNVLNRLVSLVGYRNDVRVLLATVLLELREPDKALTLLTKAEANAPDEVHVWNLMARTDIDIDRVGEAQPYLDKAVAVQAQVQKSTMSEILREEAIWKFNHCGSLVHYCRQCLYLRECR